MTNETQFIETQALLAVIQCDDEMLASELGKLSENEAARLAAQARFLFEAARARARREYIPKMNDMTEAAAVVGAGGRAGD